MTQQSLTAARREAARERTGQFGEQVHSAPEVALALDSISWEELDAAEERRLDAARERESVKAWLENVKRASSFYAYKRGHGQDRKDIEGDTIVDMLHQKAPMTEAYTNRVASNKTWQYVNHGEHHTATAARGSLRAWTDTFLQEHGRFPTSRERSAMAQEIRLAQKPGERAVEGYEDRRVFLSLDEPAESFGGEAESIGDLLPEVSQSGYATDTSRAASANDMLEDEDSSFKAADARKCIWNLLAEDAPQVAVKTIDDDRAHRGAIDAVGGPIAAARAWASGESPENDPATVALFAPFGSRLTEKDREAVVEVLVRNPAYAMKVWDSAMSAALDVQRLRTIKRRESRQAAAQAERELIAA